MMKTLETMSLFLYLGAAISLANAWQTWNTRLAWSRTYTLLLTSTAVWAIFGAHELQSHSHALQPLWSSLSYLGAAWVGPLLYLTTADSRHANPLSRHNLVHFIFPVSVLLLVMSNPWHHFFYSSYEPVWVDYRPMTRYQHGWAFWYFIVGTYFYCAYSTGMILHRLFVTKGDTVVRVLWGVAFALPWLANFLYLGDLITLPGLDPTPLAFTFTAVLLTIAMRRQNFFDLKPIANSSLLKNIADAVLVFDTNSVLTDFNPAAEKLLKTKLTNGKTSLADLSLPALPHDRTEPLTVSQSLVSHKCIPLGTQAVPIGSLHILHDVTARVAAETRIRLLSKAVESGPTAVVVTDARGRIVYVNPRFCAVSGYSESEVLGRHPPFLNSRRNPPRMYKTIWEKIRLGQVWRGELFNRRKNGISYWHRVDIAALHSPQGEITHFVALTEDITDRKVMQERLEEMASTDPLSGHYNRRFVLQMGQKEFARHRRNCRPLSIAVCDIDHFRTINDVQGHCAGDEVLIHLAGQLRSLFREGDLIGRFDGGAFLLVFPDTDSQTALQVCQRLKQLPENPPAGVAYTVSMGIAAIQSDSSLEGLIRRASLALQSAKVAGCQQIVLSDPA